MRRRMFAMFGAIAALILLSAFQAQAGPTITTLYDPSEPGSILVFPKFVRGTVASGLPATEFEISVHCPVDIQAQGGCGVPGTAFKLIGEWICPGQFPTFPGQVGAFTCKENDFIISTTIEGTVSFNTEGSAVGTNFATVQVPAPLCPEGYLIVYAVSSGNHPIHFDGLVGDAVVRWNNHAAGSYKAIAIQAEPTAVAAANLNAVVSNTNMSVAFGNGTNTIFDGASGHYAAVTGTVMASVKYDTSASGPDSPVETTVTLLTLNTRINLPNNDVFTDLDFYDANENILSESLDYICWSETNLDAIDPNLDQQGVMTRKGFFVSIDENKIREFGVADISGPVMQLGLIDTMECEGTSGCAETVPVTPTNNPNTVNHYMFRTDDDSIPVVTQIAG